MLSFLGYFFVFRQNRFASSTVEVQPEQRVISTGLYRVVRHPMYALSIALFVDSALGLASPGVW